MNKNDLCRKIEENFADVPYPGDDDLTVHPLGFDESFYEAIEGKNYKEIDQEIFNYHNDCIGVLTAKGFQYYLPGFLITDLMMDGTSIFSQLLYWLSVCQNNEASPILDVSGIDWLNPRIEILSNAQKDVLIKYFEFYKNDDLEEEELDDVDRIINFIKKEIGK